MQEIRTPAFMRVCAENNFFGIFRRPEAGIMSTEVMHRSRFSVLTLFCLKKEYSTLSDGSFQVCLRT
jgi:hypothetical protein